ncbi:MAG TPA: hypothetical protein VMI10_22590 [Terriglobales bacterium]|nr:hypothetical protein [Terriglobales bacterium]
MAYKRRDERVDSIKKLCQQEAVTIEEVEKEEIKGLWNVRIILSDGGRYIVGPRGGLWHYLTESQRNVHPNEWDKGIDNTLTDSDFVREIAERRRRHGS